MAGVGLWRGDAPLVLASRSEVRGKVLAAAAIPLEIMPAQIDERAVEAQSGVTAPARVAVTLARAKALAISAQLPGRVVLGADQTLALAEQRFSKPRGRDGAAAQLRALAGKTHALHSGIALARDNRILFEHCATARLRMRALDDAMIDTYLDAAGDAALSSVGAYQIEGPGIHLFETVEGDYFTIVGMPLLPLLAYLRQAKLVAV
jgi:septum formation protein